LNAAVAIAQMRKLDEINTKTRSVYEQLRKEIQLPSCAKWVEPNDREGVCGYSLGILFEKSEQAEKTIKAGIGIGGLAAAATKGARDWHVYWNWEHIMEQKTLTGEGCPFKCPHVEELPDYNENMCPKTKDIMLRLGVIAIQPADTCEWASEYAEKINSTFKEIF
jgi:dTDP-4-amino-4,6-dideoxygalactose transaminase